jgi:anaerobic ribonucleoside-triphosphate reductase activating protein
MRYGDINVVLQEVPGEVSICFSINGCQLRCSGCHSPFLWSVRHGTILTLEFFQSIIEKYKDLASCVIFMGGEWDKENLVIFLQEAKKNNLKTCLYTGLDYVDEDILSELTFLKTGRWISELGGLKSKDTNQKFINVETGEVCNYLFH